MSLYTTRSGKYTWNKPVWPSEMGATVVIVMPFDKTKLAPGNLLMSQPAYGFVFSPVPKFKTCTQIQMCHRKLNKIEFMPKPVPEYLDPIVLQCA